MAEAYLGHDREALDLNRRSRSSGSLLPPAVCVIVVPLVQIPGHAKVAGNGGGDTLHMMTTDYYGN